MMLETLKHWAWLQHSQWLKREQLADIQARKLRAMINHAFQEVPFYQRLYSAAGVDPASIATPRNIGKLPIITKRDLRDTPLVDRQTKRLVEVILEKLDRWPRAKNFLLKNF